MSQVGQRERITQNRVAKVFTDDLGYEHLGDWKDRLGNSNIEAELLERSLRARGYPDDHIRRVIDLFTTAASNQAESLFEVNKAVYTMLRYGVTFKPSVSENNITIPLIDWTNPGRNHFAIAEEVTVVGPNTKRPDIVIYVNGIALGVIELKRSTTFVSEGIRQNLDNQRPEFIERFFTTMQLVMAGNDTQGLYYGTIQTAEKYFVRWKEDKNEDGEVERTHSYDLDNEVAQFCEKRRLLEIIHDFIIFDGGVKKICRPNQYFGVKAAQVRIQDGEGGIIWHTQGSGKSLTMVWLSKWIRENYSDARILVITDRKELDEQIEKVYSGVDEDIYRTRSGADLVSKLAAPKPLVMCSLIHKFPGQDEGDVDKFIRDLQTGISADFKAVGNFFVFVDECHRTQSGKLHRGMKELLPEGLFIGFTGTPLLKVDKQRQTSIKTFGPYIHTYKYNEAVENGVVLDLQYEARDIDQHLESPEDVDEWFDLQTAGLTDYAAAQLKQRWGTMQKVLSSEPRLQRIVQDIRMDMLRKPRLATGRGNAMLVAGSIYEACKLYDLFTRGGFTQCAIVTSYDPKASDIKGETTGEGNTEPVEKYEIYTRMLKDRGIENVEEFERHVKKMFVENPGQMKLLIVVDKLLTGFDAPSATYLYIDKQMRDHGLFQAICRVNRLDGDDKEYGHIIDYKDLFKNLEQSIYDYTAGAFDGLDEEDTEGLLTNHVARARERLDEALEKIRALCEPVEPPQQTPDYIRYFCGNTADPEALRDTEPQRLLLYEYTTSLVRAYMNIANDMQAAGYSVDEQRAIRNEVDHYNTVRAEIKIASGDHIDLKVYEPQMRQLLDMYIQADKSRKISTLDDITLIQLIVEKGAEAIRDLPENIQGSNEAVAETIENNVRRVIIEENSVNPVYYAKMSELLDTLIEQRRAQALEYEEYLAKIVDLTRQVAQPTLSADYPTEINTQAKQSLYDLLEDTDVALAIDTAVQTTKKHNWRGNLAKEREIMGAIFAVVNDDALTST